MLSGINQGRVGGSFLPQIPTISYVYKKNPVCCLYGSDGSRGKVCCVALSWAIILMNVLQVARISGVFVGLDDAAKYIHT